MEQPLDLHLSQKVIFQWRNWSRDPRILGSRFGQVRKAPFQSTSCRKGKEVRVMTRVQVALAMFQSMHWSRAARIVAPITIQFRWEAFPLTHLNLHQQLKHEGLDSACSWWHKISKLAVRRIGKLTHIKLSDLIVLAGGTKEEGLIQQICSAGRVIKKYNDRPFHKRIVRQCFL